MSAAGDPIANRVAAAGARTVAAGTARLFAAWCTGSPLPGAADRRCEGVADLGARRARVSQALLFTDRATAALSELSDDDPGLRERVEQSEMIYDGANAYVRVADRWTGFFLADPGGPRGPNDPLWPLDALFGAGEDAVQIGPEAVRGVPATRCRLTVDLARADALLPSGGERARRAVSLVKPAACRGVAGRGWARPPYLGELRADRGRGCAGLVGR
jgi:hypothetical protein